MVKSPYTDPQLSPHTRQISLNKARSPLISPSHPQSSTIPNHSRTQSLAHSRKSSYISVPLERYSEEIGLEIRKTYTGSRGGDSEAEEEELARDLEAFDLVQDGTSLGPDIDAVRYEGPFQPPIGRETIFMILSLIGVLILAVAAGFTTVYDWVL